MPRTSSRRRNLEKWLSGTTTPVFLMTADQIVTWFNRGCEELTGWSTEDVVGWRAEYNSEAEPGTVESLVASLCPPPGISEGNPIQAPAQVIHKDGRSLPALLCFFALVDADKQLDGILGLVMPLQTSTATTTESPAQRLHAELAALRGSLRQRYGPDSMIGSGPVMTRVLERIALAAGSTSSVCLVGEPATGRTHAARVIHYASQAGDQSFTPLSPLSLPPRDQAAMINRLFDAHQDESVVTEVFQPGTLFLADADQLPRDVQRQLLDRLDVPGVAMRLMASSTTPLERAVDQEQLLPELYYRLTSIPIELPPLRERTEDFQSLTQHFLERTNLDADVQIGGLTGDTVTQLAQYLWPGNLNELAHVIRDARQAAASRQATLVGVEDLPFRFRTGLDAQRTGPPPPSPIEPLETVLARVELQHITSALQQARGNKSHAAQLLGLTRPKLYRRMEQLGMTDD